MILAHTSEIVPACAVQFPPPLLVRDYRFFFQPGKATE
jgi:hypothetical protein